jgi:polyisoprenoid-binding protein YceI
MSRKTTAALVAAMGINFAMAGGALMLANLNKPTEFDIDKAFAAAPGDLKDVAGRAVDAEVGELAVPLKAAQLGGNTRVTFTCGKDTGGGTREVHEGTWDQITGGILYHPEDQALIAVQAIFDTRSLRTDAQGLTNTVTTKEKWFDIDNHPLATFTCKTVKPIDAATPSHTHDLVGSFTLNGITKPITIPAKLSFTGQSMTLDASFTILRSDFDVDKRSSSVAGTLGGVVSKVDDQVKMAVQVTASPDPTAAIGELAELITQQQEAMRIASVEIKRLQSLAPRVENLEETTSRLAKSGVAAGPSVDTSTLPKEFTDHALGDEGAHAFDMLLIPGDPEQQIAPFYMAKHEVQWGMIDRWMYGGDLDGESADVLAEMRENGIRPTPLYEEPAQMVQVKDKHNPAMAMSLKTAKAYCKWLSEETGRTYRLPTIDEWKYAMRLGGGLPEDIDAYAWHKDNEQLDFYGTVVTMPVGTKKPNTLGIYDMFGSVAEWVTGTGTDRVIVGGGFRTPREDLSEDWQMVENQKIWNASYPQLPVSQYWYSDVYYTGIRLICEPASVAANPPAIEPSGQ